MTVWERNVVKRRNEIVSRATFFNKFKTSVDCNQGGSMGKSDGSSETPLKTLAAKRKLVQENSLTQLEYQSPSKKQKKKFVDVKTFWEMRDNSCAEFKPAVVNKCTAVGGQRLVTGVIQRDHPTDKRI